MIIADTFTLANRQWRVKWMSNKKLQKKMNGTKVWGLTSMDTATIYLNVQLLKKKNEALMWHTWEHELTHAILFTYGVSGNNHNEVEIDGCAALRCQYYQTREVEGYDDGDS